MGFFSGLFGQARDRDALAPLYAAVVARAREPHWYVEGDVADSLDGRFDMVAAILSLTLLRLEAEPAGIPPSALLTELFVHDMDGQLRESGVGDIVVGKKIGNMMGVLGGRLGAYRAGLRAGGDLPAALVRNLYRGAAPADAALTHVAERLRAFDAALTATPLDVVLDGELPAGGLNGV